VRQPHACPRHEAAIAVFPPPGLFARGGMRIVVLVTIIFVVIITAPTIRSAMGGGGVKKSAHSYLLYLLTSYVLADRVEYTEDTFASASSEICVPGGSYFGYSVFPGVMLASLMHSPESLFQTSNSFY
jgi:hypothetical protein